MGFDLPQAVPGTAAFQGNAEDLRLRSSDQYGWTQRRCRFNLFRHFLIANGGEAIVTPDGKLHTDDPKVREAAIKSVEFMTKLLQGRRGATGGARSWNDADDNNGFHGRNCS